MRGLTLTLVAAFALTAANGLNAGTITVDCDGGADFTDLRLAILAAGPSDTVLVKPCTYYVEPGDPPAVPGWPVALDIDGPTIIGEGGASVTIIEGDGTTSAFGVESYYGKAHISGFTFRNLSSVFDREEFQYVFTLDLQFTDNVVESCGRGLGGWDDHGTIARNIMRHNGRWGLNLYRFIGTVEHNEICYNDNGLSYGGNPLVPYDLNMANNHVHHNAGWGVSTGFPGPALHDHLIENNGEAGVLLSGSYGELYENVIRGNNVGIAFRDNWWFEGPTWFHGNDIYGNGTYAIVAPPGVGESIAATSNWWGTADGAAIEASIYHCYDEPESLCCVGYSNWCTAPGCPSAVQASSWGAIKAAFR